MKNLITHETTEPEEIVFEILCALLEETGFEGEVHRNVEIPLGGIGFVPDIFIPQLGLVISVDGRMHEYSYENDHYKRQQRYDQAKDAIFKQAGIDILSIPNYETANRASLALRLRTILKSLITNKQPRQNLQRTRKIIFHQRLKLAKQHSERFAFRKKGSAGTIKGRKAFHHHFGFRFFFKRKTKAF